jgi:hypothetical protein
MQGGFTLVKLSAFVPDILAVFAAKGVTIVETDVLKAAAAVMAKIDSLNAAAS